MPLLPPASPRPGWVEQDARSWWPAACDALNRITADLGPQRAAVAAVAVSATSGTVLALDAAGDPLGPALTYADQRAIGEAATAQAAGAERWARLGLRIQPTFGLPKWAWLLKWARQQGLRVARLAHASDVVVGQLMDDTPPTDWSHALKSGYDVLSGEWATEAMDALGIPEDLLPPVLPPASPAGAVGQAAASATGLPAGCPVRLAMTDSCAAQLAAGAGVPGAYVSVLGSTLVLKGVSHRLVVDPAGAVYCHRHPSGWWLPGGASNCGAAVLRHRFPGRDLAALDAAAAAHGPARCVTYPLERTGERFPFADPSATGFTLGEPAGEVEAYRALLEGVAFVERLGYERMASLGAPATHVAVGGGASVSRPWNRIRAGVLGVPVVEAPGATTALGASILAANGTLHPDLVAATRAMAAPGAPVEPEAGTAEALDTNYRRFVDALADRGLGRV